MSDDITDLHLPNANNCIQAALYQIDLGNYDRAEAFLNNAQKSINKAQQSLKPSC